MAAHEREHPTSPSSPLVRSSLASLVLYSRERTSEPTSTSRPWPGVIDVGAIGQEHIGEDALVLVEAVSLECDFLCLWHTAAPQFNACRDSVTYEGGGVPFLGSPQ
jgi:hypothetical protein